MKYDTPGAPPDSRRLCALMFTDMVAWGAMTQRNEALAVEVLEHQRRIVRAALPAHGGREIRPVGDGFFISFGSALEAVRCAIVIQSAIAEHNRTASLEQRIQIRIGLHAGDVMEREGDLIGDSVNIAARIEPLAPAGGICLTAPVYEQIHNKIPEQVRLLERPELKHIETPLDVYRVVLPWEPARGGRERAVKRTRPRKRWPVAALALVLLGTLVGALLGSVALLRGTAKKPPVPGDSPPPIRSLAVLPLRNLSNDPEQASFAEGVTDSLTTDLYHIQALDVKAHQSVLQYKGGTKSVQEIASELGVDAVVEGTVQYLGDTLIINIQLIHGTTANHIWADRYTQHVSDMARAENEIVLAITDKIKVQLRPEEKTRLAVSRPVPPQAQKSYFWGRFHFSQGTEAGYRQAIRDYEQAIQLDRGFAPAYAGLADVYTAMSSTFYMAPREAMPKAETAARAALDLDPDLAEAHSALGYIQTFYHWNRVEGERELLRAIELKPSYSTAHVNYGSLLASQARFEEALKQLRKAQELEPTSAMISLSMEWMLFLAGKYQETLTQADHTLKLEPKMSFSHLQKGLAYLYLHNKPEALSEMKRAFAMEANTGNATTYAFGLAVTGKQQEAERVLDRFLEQSKGKYVCAYEVATVYEGMNNRLKALEWLRRGQQEKCDCLVWGAVEPMMRGIRTDPRYQALLAESGLLH
jgi:class 3 adenylate cyclase/TolB-like protein/Tfp pilus assembly protein PilF